MKFLVYCFLTIYNINVLSAQQHANPNFTIKGSIEGVEKGRIFLNYGRERLKCKIEDGKFTFSGVTDSTYHARFKYRRFISGRFYLDSSTMDIKVVKSDELIEGRDYSQGLYIEEIQGSLTNDLKLDYERFLLENFGSQRFNYLLYNYLNQKISQHPKIKFYYDLIYHLSSRQKHLNYKQFLDLAYKLDTRHLVPLQKQFLLRSLQNAMYMGIGSDFPTAKIYNKSGKIEDLKNQYGVLTLITVWRFKTWSVLNIDQSYVDLFKKYKSKGFNFFVINLRENIDRKSFINSNQSYNWKNYHSFDLADKLKLPKNVWTYNYLIDNDGVIIDINLSAHELEKILNLSFKKS